MTDEVLTALAEYVASTTLVDTTGGAVERMVGHLVDTIGCGLGGLGHQAHVAMSGLLDEPPHGDGASVIGASDPASVEHAILVNTAAVRALDFNDNYPGVGHPSDMWPALIATAETVGASGAELIRAALVAYEVFVALGDAYGVRDAGFDQGALVATGVAAGVSNLIGLDVGRTRHAISLAVTSNMHLRSVRTGVISLWKGAATAPAAMSGQLVARLAASGMTGPDAPFTGVDGFERQIRRRRDVSAGQLRDGLSAVERCNIKSFQAEVNSQALLQLLGTLRPQIDLSSLAGIEIRTFHQAWHEIGGGQGDVAEKWDPTTRESADHSLPYLVARFLADGSLDEASYATDKIRDASLRPLMDLITIDEEPTLTALWPEHTRSEILVRHESEPTVRAVTNGYRGHWAEPFDRDDHARKFFNLVDGLGPEQLVTSVWDEAWRIAELDDIRSLTSALRGIGRRADGSDHSETQPDSESVR